MSLRIVPSASHPDHTEAALGAPSAPGVHDTLRANLSLTTPAPKTGAPASAAAPTSSFHPLESRLAQWRAQQDSLKMEMLRRQFGIAEPVKRGMELAVVRGGDWTPACLGAGAGMGGARCGSSVHADILEGRDAELDWEDVFTGEEMRDQVDFHTEMERRFGMNW